MAAAIVVDDTMIVITIILVIIVLLRARARVGVCGLVLSPPPVPPPFSGVRLR